MGLEHLKENFKGKKKRFSPHTHHKKLLGEFFHDAPMHHPDNNSLYCLLALIYDGITTKHDIKQQMKCLFISASHQMEVSTSDIEQAAEFALTHQMITENEIDYTLTELGRKVVEASYLETLRQNFWLRKLLSHNSVLYLTTIALVFLSFTKIFAGLNLQSQGLLSDGFDNLTDLVKLGLVFLAIKYDKERIMSIIIMSLMLFTGGSIFVTSIQGMLNVSTPEASIEAFLIAIISITLNIGLMYLKGLVGRVSGNLALLSDAKDAEINVKISLSVLIGLVFAIFDIGIMDSLVGLFISLLIFKEGLETLIELVREKDEIQLTKFRVKADQIYDHRLTGYLLANVRRTRITKDELHQMFETGLEVGRKYFEGFADFFYAGLGTEEYWDHLKRLIEAKFIFEENNELFLTEKGLRTYYHSKANEYHARSHNLSRRATEFRHGFYILVIILLFLIVGVFIDELNSFIR